jgi:hypothetical protein
LVSFFNLNLRRSDINVCNILIYRRLRKRLVLTCCNALVMLCGSRKTEYFKIRLRLRVIQNVGE